MRLKLIETLGEFIHAAQNLDHLYEALARASYEMGFQRFALALEIGLGGCLGSSVLIHNYPRTWADVYIGLDLSVSDPVRRAGERSIQGFRWDQIGDLIALTPMEAATLETGRLHGLVDGFTVPRHLPGAITATCTFVSGPAHVLPAANLVVAEVLGTAAIARASHLSGGAFPNHRRSLFTDRQRDCVLWSARDMTDHQIAARMGISRQTVIQHFKDARLRSSLTKRGALIAYALFEGAISFADIFRWRDPG